MRAILTLQLPSDDLKSGRILAATSDSDLIAHVCRWLLAERRSALERVDSDVFERELARLEFEQLRARLSFALKEPVDE